MMCAAGILLVVTACSSQKNTAKSRFWHAFNARYNTYYNGSLAFIDGSQEKEKGNDDNFTEMIPLYMVGNKKSRDLGKSNFDRAILKSEKAIKLHSIKRRPEWNKRRRKTPKDIEWLGRREYNPFLWKAWLLMGKSQFQQGNFDEAAATFSYMTRMYSTQPSIRDVAKSWLVRSYAELDWIYDAEDVITKARRDTIHYRAAKDWDYAYADFYIHNHQYAEAVPYLRKVIRHEHRRLLKARQWYLMGQIQNQLGNKQLAYQAFRHVPRLNPPYRLAFNARIAQTEVMASGSPKKMIRKLKRMAVSDNNADYLDQVYYALGNIYLTSRDTLNAIASYERGSQKSTRNGIEKGVLLLRLGNLYWQREQYTDAQRCYGVAIGLLDKDRDDYEQLSERSKVLDELVPHTEAVHLQDSLQALAAMSETDRNKAIDRVIEALEKKEKEERRAAQEQEAEKYSQKQGSIGNTNGTPKNNASANQMGQKGMWYFYNPMAVSQGKAAFQKLWGKRENVDNWQRVNQTVVNLQAENGASGDEGEAQKDVDPNGDEQAADGGKADKRQEEAADSAANDPHKREYYLAQIPFSEDQKKASDDAIMDGLYNAGVIFKDKLDNLSLGRKNLERLVSQYPDYPKGDEAYYHLFLLYSRLGDEAKATACLDKMKERYQDSEWTVLLSDPYFKDNARFGEQMEDSLYSATYDAFKANRYEEVAANAKLSEERFPSGANRPKFIFIDALSQLNEGHPQESVERLKVVVEKFPKSEVAEMAGMIVKGVQEGRRLHGGQFDLGDIWSRRTVNVEGQDSLRRDTLSKERNTNFIFLLAYEPDSVDTNRLLFQLAKYNFSNFMVRNFDIAVDDDNGIGRMMVSGFLSYDEALQYARRLYADRTMTACLKGCRRIIVSEANLPLLGTSFSYADYQKFFEDAFAPLKVSNESLLNNPEGGVQQMDPDDIIDGQDEEKDNDDGQNAGKQNNDMDFDEDFYR